VKEVGSDGTPDGDGGMGQAYGLPMTMEDFYYGVTLIIYISLPRGQ